MLPGSNHDTNVFFNTAVETCPLPDLLFSLVHHSFHAAPTDESNKGQSNAADILEEEQKKQEAHDGSLWWHGMFVKAGRMGDMAADVQADSKPQVCAFLSLD